ncbi:DUF1365 family protein [Halodesulfovibrio marinisediminis]|uniref:Cyclopropane-fatty-acyl-phospholipid synthase n=1 Tax=Halodesulfovibrio marinisediminis DSM 17456 TaxID=1121457 RepID=A0A1N6DV84_9BACT|nr:DUF1365 family protein [Halodesulfovibrio marinisediminis]SIN74706.1 cyclopropane-fatty-acyl-phospholipid synthase [Halodesulfovibrio marinisediminis DSM 17456]
MNSSLITCRVQHERFAPKKHAFSYPLYTYLLDIDELQELNQKRILFGYNKLRLASFHDKDYLQDNPASVRQKLTELLNKQDIELAESDIIYLVTSARFVNYSFNPVSFYWIFRDNCLQGCVAEVNNTFGEKHVYPLPGSGIPASDSSTENTFPARYQHPKQFHVSPFMDLTGEYHFTFEDVREHLDVTVELFHGTDRTFKANLLEETRVPLTDMALLKTAFTKPLTAHLTMPRILWEAGKLHYGKGIHFYSKPEPVSDMTIRHKDTPKITDRLATKLVQTALQRMQLGQLTLTMPDGSSKRYGDEHTGSKAELTVNSPSLFRKIACRGDIGLGEGYSEGLWDSPDVVDVIRFFLENRKIHTRTHNALTNTAAILSGAIQRHLHLKAPQNDEAGSKANIAAHYDLSNELFRHFLDPTMTYSSGVFINPADVTEDLEEAQLRKNRLLADKAQITADDHVLEIGCGWGGFAEQTAKERGCRITGVTLSQEQYTYATQRIKDADLDHLVDIQLRDYRTLSSQYDKIVSIEMLEAVGHKFHAEYFQKLEDLLAPSGLAAIQTITIQDAHYDHYRWGVDWVRKHIFPGGELLSLARICEITSDTTSLSVQKVQAIGLHYANTLNQWRKNFEQQWPQITKLGFDDYFRRTWIYYLASCEAAFLQGYINDLHILLSRPPT